jgi:hypothetical protein
MPMKPSESEARDTIPSHMLVQGLAEKSGCGKERMRFNAFFAVKGFDNFPVARRGYKMPWFAHNRHRGNVCDPLD